MYSNIISSSALALNNTVRDEITKPRVIVRSGVGAVTPLPFPSAIDYGPYDQKTPGQVVAPALKRCVDLNSKTSVLKSSSVAAIIGSRS